jgi:hypothetical protein
MEVINVKDQIMCLYCGPKVLKPIMLYTPFGNLNDGDFVTAKPYDPFLVLV